MSNVYKTFKKGEQLTRYCHRKRSETYSTIHDFTIYSSVFNGAGGNTHHLKALAAYLSRTFISGCPHRESSASQTKKKELEFEPYESDLVKHADASGYRGWGKNQHPIVQRYLHENDPFTIATEVPVWNNSTSGFIDILRIHANGLIEIADFKPYAKKEKKAAAQVKKYKDILCKTAYIPPEKVFCTWFDDEDSFILLDS
jgi:hypothetical protein